jgi:hypothetical protein
MPPLLIGGGVGETKITAEIAVKIESGLLS